MASPTAQPPTLSPSGKQEDTPMPDQTNSSPLTLPSLPPLLASLLPSLPHSPKDQETFAHRKAEIMRKFTLSQIQALYEEETAKVLLMLEEDRRNNEEIKKEIEKLEKQQELERRIYSKMPSRREKEDEEKKIGLGISEQVAIGKDGEEGEVLEDGEDVKMEGV